MEAFKRKNTQAPLTIVDYSISFNHENDSRTKNAKRGKNEQDKKNKFESRFQAQKRLSAQHVKKFEKRTPSRFHNVRLDSIGSTHLRDRE